MDKNSTPPDTRPSTPGTPMTSKLQDAFEFDERAFSLAAEQDKQSNPTSQSKQELYVFQWLAGVERELKHCSQDTVAIMQPNLERQLLKLISSPSPKPRHPIRRLIARCFLSLYIRGKTSTLFETIQLLTSLVEAGKGLGDKDIKLAAIHCIGVIMETIGEKILSLAPDLVATLLKVIKADKIYPLIMRVEAMDALRKVLRGAGRGTTDPICKDVLKSLKVTLLDKALILRSSTADCLTVLVKSSMLTLSRSEFDQSITLFIKAMDDSTFAIRKSVATLIATLLDSKSLGEENLTMNTKSPVPGAGAKPAGQQDAFTLDVTELLTYLSTAYNRPNTSREVRAGITETYAALFILLGPAAVERSYAVISKHLLVELVSFPKNASSRFEILTVREHVGYLLRSVIGTRLLSESGQISSIRELNASWLKAWPAIMAGDVEPSEHALVSALNETSALVLDLGGAASSIQDVLMVNLTNLITHPSLSVQTAASWCLRCFCISLPTNLAKLLQTLTARLTTDLGTLGQHGANFQDVAIRAQGLAYAVGGLISVISVHPLYVSFEMSARIFSMAAQMIKSSANKELVVAAAQIQNAWILIGALMCLGPNFVKMHLPQLLLLWKNALPKLSSKDATSTARSELDWVFMLHVRECALGSVASFLLHNGEKLVTTDVSKRVALLLNNTLAFVSSVPNSFPTHPPGTVLPELLKVKLSDRDDMIRKRIFECFVAMRHVSSFEIYHPALVKAAVDVFSDPERTSGTPVGNAIAAATFSGVWTMDDGYGYGVTGKVQGLRCDVAARTSGGRTEMILDGKDYDSATHTTESMLQKPILGAPEFDPLVIYTTFALPSSISLYSIPKPRPVATGVIDYAIELFAILFPLQAVSLQESLMDHLTKMVKNSLLDKNPGRKTAIHVNTVVALLGATKYAMAEGKRSDVTAFNGPIVSSMSQALLRESIVHADPYLRYVACEALGRLTSLLGSQLIASQIKYLMEQVVANRDPDARAGYALALGNVFSHLGGMMAGGHLRSIVEYLTSLSRDPHPIVHKWSLHSLALTIESAGLMFSPYVSSTLTNVATFYIAESHEPAGASSVATANIAMQSELSVYHELGRIIYGLIGILGPELVSSAKVRELCVSLVQELRNEDDEFVVVQGIRCTQHLIMFAPLLVDMSSLVPFLQARLRRSTGLSLKKAAMTCMYQLVQRDVKSVFQHARGGLDDQFFKLLDTDPTLHDVKDVVRSWITQTALEQPSQWIEICRKVLSRTAIDDGQDGADQTDQSSGAAGRSNEIQTSTGEDDQDFGDDDDDVSHASSSRRNNNGSSGNVNGGGQDDDEDDEEVDDNDNDDDDEGGGFETTKPKKVVKKKVAPTTAATTSTNGSVSTDVAIALERPVKAAPALPPRWRTRIFALECIRQVIDAVATSGIADHFDLALARRKKKNFGTDYLVLKVADLIKMAVYAASTPIQEIKMEGLLVLRQTIERFKGSDDPEVPGSVLLEQYQAQIGAALTPAFTAESTPEVVSLGVKVCAVYVGSGIIQEVDRFGRVLKLLIGALEKCKDERRLTAVGDVTDLTPHASQMIKWAVLNAWAELQVASVDRPYLQDVLRPNLSELCKLWAVALEEYARSKVEAESGTTAGSTSSSVGLFDATYTDPSRDSTLSFDQSSTLKILGAVSSLLEKENKVMIQTVLKSTLPGNGSDGGDADGNDVEAKDGGLRIQIAATKKPRLVHMIFGLCLDILAKTAAGGAGANNFVASSMADESLQGCLLALQAILKPNLIEKEFLSEPLFLEMMMILERVAWMEGSRVQGLVVGVISNLIQGYSQVLLFTVDEIVSAKLQDGSSKNNEGTPIIGEASTLVASPNEEPVATPGTPTTSSSATLPDHDPIASESKSTLPGRRLTAIVQLLVELAIQKCIVLQQQSNNSTNSTTGRRMSFRPKPLSGGQKSAAPETIELLGRVIEMLTLLVRLTTVNHQKIHLAGVSLHVALSVLNDPSYQLELGGKILVCIKSIMESLEKSRASVATDSVEADSESPLSPTTSAGERVSEDRFLELVVNGAMGTLVKYQPMFAPGSPNDSVETVEDVDMDVSPLEIASWSNNLLAMMLILTQSTHTRIQRKFMDRYERLLRSSIESRLAPVVTVGYQCLKSMILLEAAAASAVGGHQSQLGPFGKVRGRVFMEHLIPIVVTTIVVKAAQYGQSDNVTKSDGEKGTASGALAAAAVDENGLKAIEEGIQILKTLASVSDPAHRSGVVTMILCTLIPLLSDNDNHTNTTSTAALHTLGLNQLLSVGTLYPQDFRQGLTRLSTERRSRLENAIRQNVVQQQAQQQLQEQARAQERERQAREDQKIKIQLKSNFDGFM